MAIVIGCDLHSCFQQVAVMDLDAGELLKEQRLEHEGDEVRNFYQSWGEPVTVAIEATGYTLWFARLAAGPELPQRYGARSQGQNREIRNGGSLPGSDSREGARSKRRKAAAGDGEGAYMDVRDRAGFGENAAPRRLSPRPAPLLQESGHRLVAGDPPGCGQALITFLCAAI